MGPNRIFAVETKWTAKKLTVSPAGVSGMGFDPVSLTVERADKLGRLLRSRGHTTPVVPVLVLWGPGVPRLEGGKVRVGTARVLSGLQMDEWRGPFEQRLWRSRSTEPARAILLDYMRNADEHHKNRRLKGLPPPRRKARQASSS